MTLDEYEVVLAEKRAGLNQQREAAYKARAGQPVQGRAGRRPQGQPRKRWVASRCSSIVAVRGRQRSCGMLP